MKKKLLTFPMLGLLAISSFGFALKTNSVQPVVEVRAARETVAEYYSSISDNLSGQELTKALNSLNNKKRIRTIGYKQHRNYYKYTEKLPDTPSGKMYGFYDNALVSDSWDNQATWNHEHVWPNSLGGGSVDGDIHMPRPTSVKINSSRGNKYYAASGAYDPGQYIAEYRGVAARIIFYCAIANTNLQIVDKTSGGSNEMGKLSDLLEWNLKYLPTKSDSANIALRVEQVRNNAIASADIQGNRNPFIDHPEYACKIWGNTNDKTRSICASQPTPTPTPDPDPDPDPTPTPEKTAVDLQVTPPSKVEYTVGESLDKTGMVVKIHYDDNTYSDPISTYTVSPEKFETVGEVTVNVTATYDSKSLSASFKVNVKEAPAPAPAPSNGCGGNVATTSIVTCSLALLGVSGIVISYFVRKKKKKIS